MQFLAFYVKSLETHIFDQNNLIKKFKIMI